MKAPPDKRVATRMPRLRRLSDEEIELWTQVAASVTPRPEANLPLRRAAPPVAPAPTAPAAPVAPRPAAQRQRQPPFAPLERSLKRKLSRGRMTADAAIDLHGFRQTEAHTVLHRFLVGAQHDGARVVLVVTGKGSRGGDALTDGPGVLKRAVPLWLALPEFRPLVVGFEEAGRAQGGAGALYIRLRRATTY